MKIVSVGFPVCLQKKNYTLEVFRSNYRNGVFLFRQMYIYINDYHKSQVYDFGNK